MKYNKAQTGYSLVEVLIAVSVLMISIVGPLTIASKGLKNATLAKQQNTAFFLAEEGIEGVIKIREESALKFLINPGPGAVSAWTDVRNLSDLKNCVSSNPCGIDTENDMEIFACKDRTCDLYLHTDVNHIRYQHAENSGGPLFHREIFLDTDGSRVRVKSVVSWGDTTEKKVELESYVYNIYESN